jgi:hypothetical protein
MFKRSSHWALSLLAIVAAALPAVAGTKSGSLVESKGNSHVRASRSVYTESTATSSIARSNGRIALTGQLLNLQKELAAVEGVINHNGSGGSAKMRVAGITVSNNSLSTGTHCYSKPIYELTVLQACWSIVDVGVANVKICGFAKAGAQFSACGSAQTSPPKANLSLAAQVYGNAGAGLTASVLGGVFSGSVEAQVNFFNHTLNANCTATPSGFNNSSATLQTIWWRLYCRAKAKLFGSTVGSSTLIDITGPSNNLILM